MNILPYSHVSIIQDSFQQYFSFNVNPDTTLSVSVPKLYLSIKGIQEASCLLTKK